MLEMQKNTLELKSVINGVEFLALPEKIKNFYTLIFEAYNSPERSAYKLDIAATGLTLTEASAIFKTEKERVEAEGIKIKLTGNPWKKGTAAYNLTDQGQILKHDPALAARLQREAATG